jgi:rhodanese-related sulfurtransferase
MIMLNRSIALAVLLLLAMTGYSQQTFQEMADEMSGKRAPVVYAESLDAMRGVFLDAREREEYEVSHLPGAAWIGYSDFDVMRLSALPKDQMIVVYCSVGYRSSKLAAQLRNEGFTHVFNLWGGIFHWYNSGRKVVNDAGETDALHTYNTEWSKWVTLRK